MTWFEKIFGVEEVSTLVDDDDAYAKNKLLFKVDRNTNKLFVNKTKKEFELGKFSTPSLGDMRRRN